MPRRGFAFTKVALPMMVNVGDLVDVRCVAVAIHDRAITVRIAGTEALHQLAIASSVVQGVTPRPLDHAATDPRLTSFVEQLPHNRERTKANNT